MNCPENEKVCSVKKENNLGYYRLHTIWKNDGFFINIASRDGAWRGEMTPDNVKETSRQLEITPEAYLEQCKEALTCHDGKQGMVYAVENGMFTWKKIVDEDSGIKIKMGSVMLESANFIDTIQNLVNVALNCNKKLQNEVSGLIQEKEAYLANRNELIIKLNELIKTKEEMEENLYKRFLLLLNAKKKKILELENAMENKVKKNEQVIKNEKVEDPYEVETDDESFSEKEISPRKRKTDPKQSPNLSPERILRQKKAKNIEEAVNDINLGDADVDENDSCEPGPSKSAPKIRNLKIPSTKDELLDYFYGTD